MSALKEDELAMWHAWKRASEAVLLRVDRALSDKTELSGHDFAVLSRLVDLGEGAMRQVELGTSMGWDKSRLSHHLSRMAERGLIARKPDGVHITAKGKQKITAARAIHAAAVRTELIERVPRAQRSVVLRLLETLAQ